MKLVAIVSHGYPLFGGGQITVWTLLKGLCAGYGFECSLFTPYPRKLRYTEAGVGFASYRDDDELRQMVRAAKPDVLLATLDVATSTLQVAQPLEIPAVTYLQSFEDYRPTRAEKRRWRVDPDRKYPSLAQVKYIHRTADLQLVNSRFLQACYARKYGLRTRVLYPEFERATLPVERTPRYITGICGMPYKGADIFLGLADAFPQEQFLLVGDIHPDYRAQFQARPNILLRGRDRPKNFLRESKIVVVPSQWPEPFGRIAVEAMGCGIPTLVSETGGLPEIIRGALPGVGKFRDVKEWTLKLGALVESEDLRAARGAQGRRLAERFLQGKSTATLARWLTILAGRKRPRYDAPPGIVLRGAQTTKSAFAMVNAALYQGLAQLPGVRIQGAASDDPLALQLPDIVIDSDFAQNFSTLTPPAHGKWVVVRTWDFGPFPERWVNKINRECDQLWVHSRWVRAQAIAGGVEPRRVRCVPLGIDPGIFTPQGAVYPLATKKRFKFLFVGATVLRKGIDLLLEAYGQAFTREDDVCLVIKDHARDVFYKGISFRDEIAKWQANPRAPEILYLDTYLSAREMGALYRACDVSVFPYRAEGFGMPILEAMASGTPPIVPRFGACLDFCNDATSFLMPVRRIRVPVNAEFAFNTLGFTEELQRVDFGQVRVATLSEYLVQAYKLSRAELQYKAQKGVRRAHDRFTWQDSAKAVLGALAALEKQQTPYRLRELRQEAAERQKKLEAARRLYEAYLFSKSKAG